MQHASTRTEAEYRKWDNKLKLANAIREYIKEITVAHKKVSLYYVSINNELK